MDTLQEMDSYFGPLVQKNVDAAQAAHGRFRQSEQAAPPYVFRVPLSPQWSSKSARMGGSSNLSGIVGPPRPPTV